MPNLINSEECEQKVQPFFDHASTNNNSRRSWGRVLFIAEPGTPDNALISTRQLLERVFDEAMTKFVQVERSDYAISRSLRAEDIFVFLDKICDSYQICEDLQAIRQNCGYIISSINGETEGDLANLVNVDFLPEKTPVKEHKYFVLFAKIISFASSLQVSP